MAPTHSDVNCDSNVNSDVLRLYAGYSLACTLVISRKSKPSKINILIKEWNASKP